MTTQTNPAVNDPIAEFESFALKPRYECNNKGVFWIENQQRWNKSLSPTPVMLYHNIYLTRLLYRCPIPYTCYVIP